MNRQLVVSLSDLSRRRVLSRTVAVAAALGLGGRPRSSDA
jgi:hypothetical protein